MTIGRNDLCPCGSNRKFKNCYLKRVSEPELETEDKKRLIDQVSTPAKKCFFSNVAGGDCEGKIINSHTVSKSGSLKKISENGHVYSFESGSIFNFECRNDLKVKSIGVSKASTFPGFCQFHDKSLFSPIEDKKFVSNEYNSALLGYRALTMEIYAKENAKLIIPILRKFDSGKPLDFHIDHQMWISDYEEGLLMGLRDLYSAKEKFDQIFLNQNFSKIKFCCIKFSNSPDILFSGCLCPEFDFTGQELNNLLLNISMDAIFINAIATPDGGVVTFQWFDNCENNAKFVETLISLDQNVLSNVITQFAFESFENLYFSPNWWNQLEVILQEELKRKTFCGVNPPVHNPKCFIPDGRIYSVWQNPIVEHNL